MNNRPIYKLVDSKGRVLIPKMLRDAAKMEYGDIVRLGLADGKVSIRKVDVIEAGDQSRKRRKHNNWDGREELMDYAESKEEIPKRVKDVLSNQVYHYNRGDHENEVIGRGGSNASL